MSAGPRVGDCPAGRGAHRPRRAVAVLLAVVLACVVGAVPAAASEEHPTLDEVSAEVMCPTCSAPLDRSESPAADRMRVYIKARIDDGWTKQQIKDGLVEQYGGDTSILATPPARGGGVRSLVWYVPAAMLAGVVVVGAVVLRRWSRRGRGDDAPRKDDTNFGEHAHEDR